jgi:dTDP-4-amino-4,6-dideoxygalactose transaminase
MSQLKKLPWFLERRREIADRYCEAFGMKYIEGHAYHLFVILVEDRDRVRQELADRGVGTQIHYKPVHLQPFYQKTYGYKYGDFPKAEWFYEHCLSIPCFPGMTDAEIDHVIHSVLTVARFCDMN